MADGITAEVSCLSFFTAGHPNHDAQWRMPGSSCPFVCVACLVEILELEEELLIRKRKVVGEMVGLLSRDSAFVKLLVENPRITSHLCSILLSLLHDDNELLVKLTIELVQEIVCKIRCENLIEEILNSLEASVTQNRNLKKSCPHVSLIGRLLGSFAPLANLMAHRSDFLEFLLLNVTYPDEKIQAAILFVLAAVCKGETSLSILKSDFKRALLDACCGILSLSKSRDLQLNSLAVMKWLVKDTGFLLSTSSSGKNVPLAGALKKVLLCADETLRIVSTQVVCDILSQDPAGSHAKELLKHGIGEFLFEGLESNNEVILGSLFCCFCHLCKTEVFFDGGFSLYGIESVILGLASAIQLGNMSVIRQGLEVLTLILARQPTGVSLFHANPTLFDSCVCALQQALMSPEHKVLIQATTALEQLLQLQHMPPIAPLTALVTLLSTMMSLLKRFLKPISSFRNIKAAVAHELLLSLLKTTKRAFQFIDEYATRVPSYASLLADNQCPSSSDDSALSEMSTFLMNSLDQLCIPAIMVNFEDVENPEIFENLCFILNNRLSSEASDDSLLGKKLLASSFLRLCLEVSSKFCQCESNKELSLQLSSLLKHLCLATYESSEQDQVRELLDLASKEFPKSTSACLMSLSQRSVHQKTGNISDAGLFNTQCLCIEILYAACKNHDMLVTEATLMKTLKQYVALHSDISHLPTITQKHLVHLYIQCANKLKELEVASPEQGHRYASPDLLSQTLADVSLDQFERIVTIDASSLEWVFSWEVLAVKFGQFMLTNWLRTEQPTMALCELLRSNPFCSQALLSLVTSSEPGIVNKGLEVLEDLFDKDRKDFPGNFLSKCVMDCFHKLLLNHQRSSLQRKHISSIIRIVTAILINSGELDIKLVHHIVNNLTNTEGSPETSLPSLNFLNVLVQENRNKAGQISIGAFLLSKKVLCESLQHVSDNITSVLTRGTRHARGDLNVYSSALLLIGQLIVYQTELGPSHYSFRLPKEDVIQLLHENESVLGIAALVFWKCIFYAMVKKQEHAYVFTKGQDESLLTSNDLQAVLAFIQNYLVHESEIVRQTAVLCLEGLLLSADNPSEYADNPWNRIVLESQLTVLDPNTLEPSFIKLASLLLQHSTLDKKSLLEAPMSTILERISLHQPKGQEITWSCLVFLKEIFNKMATSCLVPSQREAIIAWLKEVGNCSLCEQHPDLSERDGYLTLDRTLFSATMIQVRVPKDGQLVSYLAEKLRSDN